MKYFTLRIFSLISSTVLLLSSLINAKPLHYAIPPINAYSVGMGNALVSVTDDPAVIYWNPAGFGLSEVLSIDFSLAFPEVETPGSWSFLVVNSSSEDGSKFGMALIRRNIIKDNMRFKTFEILTPVSHVYKSGRLPVGFSLKFMSEKVEDAGWKYGMGIDSGIMLLLAHNVKVGLSVQNLVGSNLSAFDSKTWLGASWGGYPMPITVAVQVRAERLRNRTFTSNNYNLGLRVALTQRLPEIRAGWITSDGENFLTLGFTHENQGKKSRISYAFAIDPDGWSDKSHFITYSWSIHFYKKTS